MAASKATPLLHSSMPPIPSAPWSKALLSSSSGRRLPQAIAHRGYKALYPENTMLAFRAAVKAGTHALETDIHLSRDGEVVLSHDASLRRCFGVDRAIATCNWEELSPLRTLRAPHEPMPRLSELLGFLAEPKNRHVWLLLDVKIDDAPDELLGAVARVVKSVGRDDGVSWDQRIVVGCWTQSFIHASRTHLPTFPVSHISHSPRNSSRFLRSNSPLYAGLSFNMLQLSLVGPCGARFVRSVRSAPDAKDRNLFVWTVNEVEWMEWSIRHGMDGVVTDDPAKYLDVLRRWDPDSLALGSGVYRDLEEEEEQDSLLGRNGKEVSNEDADGDVSLAWATTETKTSWTRWARLYFQVATIQVLLAVVAPIVFRNTRWRFREPDEVDAVDKRSR